jgi:hypothetical protein
MGADSLQSTKRNELLGAYERNGVPFIATTRGLHSVRSLQFDVEHLDAAGGVGYLVAHRGQTLEFYSYGMQDQIQLAGNLNHRATEAETSLTTARRTVASADLSIEWITMAPRAVKASFVEASPAPQFPDFVAAAMAAGDVTLAMLRGQVALVDPFARVLAPEVGASATLQHVLYHAVAPHLTCRFEWDNADRTEKMGTCDQFSQGGGAAYLNANGEPSQANRFRIPEGFLWGRESQPTSDLTVICELRNDVVIPYTPPASILSTGFPDMVAAWVEIRMSLGGILLRVPGSN